MNGTSGLNGTKSGMSTSTNTRQTAEQQIQRLQHEKPTISTEKKSVEEVVHISRGSQWLAVLTTAGEFQVSPKVSSKRMGANC
jgi:hypothetical protein